MCLELCFFFLPGGTELEVCGPSSGPNVSLGIPPGVGPGSGSPLHPSHIQVGQHHRPYPRKLPLRAARQQTSNKGKAQPSFWLLFWIPQKCRRYRSDTILLCSAGVEVVGWDQAADLGVFRTLTYVKNFCISRFKYKSNVLHVIRKTHFPPDLPHQRMPIISFKLLYLLAS